jgi:hypothetical protein
MGFPTKYRSSPGVGLRDGGRRSAERDRLAADVSQLAAAVASSPVAEIERAGYRRIDAACKLPQDRRYLQVAAG